METFQAIESLAEINNLPPERSLPMPKIFIGRRERETCLFLESRNSYRLYVTSVLL
jgi:hypothetical protein